MGQALYRQYRSRNLSEIVGQEHITTALDHALKNGTVGHAYLFTGPRGTGKTSIARILAYEINGLPYEEGGRSHLDIIEIDAASNRRIDEIRDLRDKVHIAPSSAKYKVYIIDEVHMLTKEAFNALLKTLEEPPAHAVFILATTEVHKLPETIISRTQRYAFKPVDLVKVVKHLRHIADTEKIKIDDDALQLIAAHGEGSFRDSISLLDQVRNMAGTVTLADVQASLGIAPEELIASTLVSLSTHNALGVAESLQTMHTQGYEPSQVARQLGGAVREALLSGESQLSPDLALKLLAALVQVPASPNPRVSLEIALLDTALAGVPHTPPAVRSMPAPVAKPASPAKPAKVMTEETKAHASIQIDPKKPAAEPKATRPAQEAAASDTPKQPEAPAAPPAATTDDAAEVLDANTWHSILVAVKKKNHTLHSVLNAAQPHFEPGKVILECSYAFHQKRLNEVQNKEVLTVIIRSITGLDVQVSCIVGKGRAKDPTTVPAALAAADGEIVHNADSGPVAITQKPVAAPAADLSAISNIFGGAELLES